MARDVNDTNPEIIDASKLRELINRIKLANRDMVSLYEAQDKVRSEFLRFAMESARDAIKACLVINAGAAAGLLVFIGHLATVKNQPLIAYLSASFQYFVVGIVAAIAAQILAYVSHWKFALGVANAERNRWRIIIGLLIVISIAVFVLGGLRAYSVFRNVAAPGAPSKLTVQ